MFVFNSVLKVLLKLLLVFTMIFLYIWYKLILDFIFFIFIHNLLQVIEMGNIIYTNKCTEEISRDKKVFFFFRNSSDSCIIFIHESAS